MVAAIVITVGSLVGLESAHRRLASTYEAALQGMIAANELNEIMARTSTVVSSQRGYLLTNDPVYLAPYLSAVRRIRDLAAVVIAHYEAVGDTQATEDFARVMTLFSQRAGETIPRHELIGDDAEVGERTIDVQINRLRRKIEDDPSNPVWLQTVRGIGYRLSVD